MLPFIPISSLFALLMFLHLSEVAGVINSGSHRTLNLSRVALSHPLTLQSINPELLPSFSPVCPPISPPSSPPFLEAPVTPTMPALTPSNAPAFPPAPLLPNPSPSTSPPVPALKPPSSRPPPPHPRPHPPPPLPHFQPPPPTSASTLNGLTITEQINILNEHNAIRANYQAPALAWSSALQSAALSWALRCIYEHSKSGNVENLAASSYRDPEGLVNLWFAEFSLYDYSSPGFSMSTGHFTQMVWRSTTQLGCAMVGPADCPNGISHGTNKYGYMLVCQYSPPGNVVGQFSSNVMKPLSRFI